MITLLGTRIKIRQLRSETKEKKKKKKQTNERKKKKRKENAEMVTAASGWLADGSCNCAVSI